jgi:hypothetical protein
MVKGRCNETAMGMAGSTAEMWPEGSLSTILSRSTWVPD